MTRTTDGAWMGRLIKGKELSHWDAGWDAEVQMRSRRVTGILGETKSVVHELKCSVKEWGWLQVGQVARIRTGSR